jgi:hypothetical protein
VHLLDDDDDDDDDDDNNNNNNKKIFVAFANAPITSPQGKTSETVGWIFRNV